VVYCFPGGVLGRSCARGGLCRLMNNEAVAAIACSRSQLLNGMGLGCEMHDYTDAQVRGNLQTAFGCDKKSLANCAALPICPPVWGGCQSALKAIAPN